ncbi:OTU domain-containing protein [Psidium guajava]|nr:OTU domain-containing protein [Psidium guajava]
MLEMANGMSSLASISPLGHGNSIYWNSRGRFLQPWEDYATEYYKGSSGKRLEMTCLSGRKRTSSPARRTAWLTVARWRSSTDHLAQDPAVGMISLVALWI